MYNAQCYIDMGDTDELRAIVRALAKMRPGNTCGLGRRKVTAPNVIDRGT